MSANISHMSTYYVYYKNLSCWCSTLQTSYLFFFCNDIHCTYACCQKHCSLGIKTITHLLLKWYLDSNITIKSECTMFSKMFSSNNTIYVPVYIVQLLFSNNLFLFCYFQISIRFWCWRVTTMLPTIRSSRRNLWTSTAYP
jgi:hypothetical protein